MTFIYSDKNLIEQLLKAGEEFEKKFLKKGQTAPAASQQSGLKPATLEDFDAEVAQDNEKKATEQRAANLRTLLFNLRDQLPNAPGSGSGKSGYSANTTLNSQNMDSMGDFVEWLDSMHRVDIVTKVNADRSNRPQPPKDWWFCKIEPGTEIVTPLQVPDRSPVAYWVNPTALKQFLVSLQADKELKSNVLFQVQLLKLIQDANNQLRLGVSEEYKEPEETLPDNTELDKIPNPINKPGGSVPLYFGDLKSLQKFWEWAINKGMSTVDDQGVVIQAGTENFDQCAFISFIAARAKSRYGYRIANSQQYWNSIQAIAQEAGCDISQISGQQSQQGQQGGQGSLQDPQVLQRLVSLLPFNSQDVNFREIKKFVDTYAPLARRSDITGMAKQVNDSIGAAQQLMRQPSMIVPLQQLKAPNDLSAYHAFAKDGRLADVLYTIVNTAGIIYKDFVNTARHVLGDDATLENRRQVDAGGPWSVNMSDINQFRTDIAEEGQHGRKLYL